MSADDELTFASAGVAGVHYQRCWSCMFASHPGGWHSWADHEDVAHAEATGQSNPLLSRCACDCSLQPPNDDYIDPTDESLTDAPCGECGEVGACAYDAEGRPLIHAVSDEDTT